MHVHLHLCMYIHRYIYIYIYINFKHINIRYLYICGCFLTWGIPLQPSKSLEPRPRFAAPSDHHSGHASGSHGGSVGEGHVPPNQTGMINWKSRYNGKYIMGYIIGKKKHLVFFGDAMVI